MLGRALDASRVLHEGRNPLGIADTDLPLYFMELQGDLSATQRFSAISDFLLGDGLGSSAWAPSFVSAADASLADARAAWLAMQDRALQTQLTASEQAAQIAQLKTPYAEALQDLCGAVEGRTAEELLDSDDFDPATCFRVTGDENADCGLTSTERAVENARALAEIDQQDVDYLFCMARELSDRAGSSAGFRGEQLEVWRTECEGAPGEPTLADCPNDVGPGPALCLTCEPGVVVVPPAFPSAPPAMFIAETPQDFSLTAEQASAEMQREASEACGAPPDSLDLTVGENTGQHAECYRGSLGELALTVQAIAKDVEIARSELEDHQDAYDIVTQGCLIRQLGGQQLLSAQDLHRQTMNELADNRRDALTAADALDAVATCAGMVAGVTNVFSGVAAGVGCAAAAGKAVAMGFAHDYEAQMDRAEQDHEVLMMSIQNEIDDRACFNDAELELVGVRTAALAVQRAAIEMESTLLQFENGKRNAAALYHAGRAAEQTVANRTVWPKQYDYWVDQQVETFKARMQLAKRFTYLAVLATEYEYQMSITGASDSLREATLAAELPGDLESVLAELWQTAGTRTIRGNRPTDLKVVLSLRDQLLQLADHSELPETELRLTDRERFQLLLQSPAFRLFDEDGEYLGQRIPFQLAPLAELGLGQSTGIPLYADNDCAERVWSVNASIIGGADSLEGGGPDREDLYRGSDQTFMRLDLLKQNTFYSQWCGQPPAELGRFQTASVRPSRNLFRGATESFDPAEGEEARYSRARIEAYFNVPRAEFEADEYANGETSELAARGLYGDYALFIPAGVLSSRQSDGTYTDGLNLDEVDDILLRLDYLSVAR